MPRPVVAIVGRPNVGKSTLFNKLTGTRLAIVDNTPGVTRDRLFGDCEWLGHNMMLVDTGGIEPYSTDVILSQMRRQAQIARASRADGRSYRPSLPRAVYGARRRLLRQRNGQLQGALI